MKPRRARPFFARHPWVFVTSIARVEGEPAPGDEVEVFSHERQFIARGLFNPQSAIRVRLYRWEDEPLDEAYWSVLVAGAVRLRHELLGLGRDDPGRAYRVLSSEGTASRGSPSIVTTAGSSSSSPAWPCTSAARCWSGCLLEHTGATGVLARTERGIAEQEGLQIHDEALVGTPPDAPLEIVEDGLTYLVDLKAGQKTGFYLDQRHNRRAVAEYCQGKRVLDLFCYTGGFALSALRHGGATSVLGIDSSVTAIELARQNAVVNHLGKARFEAADVFDTLETLRARQERFGVVICDPPKFARHPKGVEDAIKGYLRLNRAAVDVLEPDGVLATCSCSGLVDRALFADVLGQAAELSGRSIQILDQRGQAPDHPVSASCLETEYLKCFICRVGAAPAAPKTPSPG